MKHLVAIICCLFVVLQQGEAGPLRRLKGAANRNLQGGSFSISTTVSRPEPDDKESPPPPKNTVDGYYNNNPTKKPTSKAPTPSPKTKAPDYAYDEYWESPSGDNGNGNYNDKPKGGGGKESSGDEYDNNNKPEPKQTENRPPRPAGASPDTQPKGSGGGGVKGASSGGSSKGGSSKGGGAKSGGSHKGGGGYKATKRSHKDSSGYNNKNKGGGYHSPDGDSYDNYPVGPGNKMAGGGQKGGSKSAGYKGGSKGGGSKGGGSKGGGSKGGGGADKSKPSMVYPEGDGPVPPSDLEFAGPGGTPLTGVPISRFALLYEIDHSLGMPMTADYEQVHENTYLWLYTVMFRTFGDRMKNLLTDDTSNIYEANQAITIEYASVALFESVDPDIPTKEELDQLVIEAFSGENLDFYVEGLQSLPPENPFSSTTSVELEQVPPGEGRSAIRAISNRVATRGMLPTFMAAGAFFVMLAGGVAAWRSRQPAENEDFGGGKHFDTFSRGGDTAITGPDDDFTASVGPLSEKRSWDLHLVQQEDLNQPNLAPISEEPMDPDLAPFSDFFDAPDSPSPSHSTTEELSQYSIEDFVNEAERNLLGVRIRYPRGQETMSNCSESSKQQEEQQEMSTALVPAPPSALVPLSTSTAIIPSSATRGYTTI